MPQIHTRIRTLSCPDQGAVAACAARLAAQARAGDTVLLDGPMAVGKTAFVIGFAVAMGALDVVSSPTYTLAHVYRTEGPPIVHVDAYRLSGPGEFLDLGLEEEMERGITLIEWAERLGAGNPDALRLEIAFGPGGRTDRMVTLSAATERWNAVLETLA